MVCLLNVMLYIGGRSEHVVFGHRESQDTRWISFTILALLMKVFGGF